MPPVAPIAPAAAAPGRRRRPVDRIITIALLAYGLVSVIVTAVSYLDLPTAMNETMKILGIDGEFTNFAKGRLWGTFAAVVLVMGWALTALLSVRRLRRGKLTWWVPVVGAAATTIAASICIMVPMMGDPAFIAYVESMAQR